MNDCGMSANSWNSFEEVRDYQIVNLYDVTGRKYKTVNYTNMQTVNTDYNEIAYYTYDTDNHTVVFLFVATLLQAQKYNNIR